MRTGSVPLSDFADAPKHVLMATLKNGMPLVDHRCLDSGAALKLARWRGKLVNTRTSARYDYHTICCHHTGASVDRVGCPSNSLTPGTLFVQPSHDEGQFESKGSVDYTHVYLQVGTIASLWAELNRKPACASEIPVAFGSGDMILNRIVRCCIASLLATDRPNQLELDSWCSTLGLALWRFATRSSSSPPDAAIAPATVAFKMSDVVDYVEENIASNISLDELAGLSGLGRFRFLRDFKKQTGLTPHQYVLERRVLRARELLEYSDTSLVEITYAVGFSSQPHMTDVFRRTLGVTPGAYRRARFS